ncbi:hypothetical protein STEG23_034148 [Scotinomys teguina]
MPGNRSPTQESSLQLLRNLDLSKAVKDISNKGRPGSGIKSVQGFPVNSPGCTLLSPEAPARIQCGAPASVALRTHST